MTTKTFVPPGGYVIDGRVFTSKQVTVVVQWYARKFNWHAATVRNMTALKQQAFRAWIAAGK